MLTEAINQQPMSNSAIKLHCKNPSEADGSGSGSGTQISDVPLLVRAVGRDGQQVMMMSRGGRGGGLTD